MNTKQLEKLKAKAKLSLKILEMIQEGHTAQEITYRTGANRQLVDYYQKAVK